MALRPKNNFISLCTGGGGLDLGVELAIPDARPVVLVEREAFAVGHLVSKMEKGILAPTPVWSDVRTFNGRPWRGLVDGVIGGIPCQPHSVAGRRLGQADERDLWSDARRIIVQSGAWWCLIENVAGMLTTGGFERIYRDLERLGFRVEAGLFTAAEVGAPHKRERLFILAVREGDELANPARLLLDPVEWREPDETAAALADAEGQRQREPADEADAVAGSGQARDEPRDHSGTMGDADGARSSQGRGDQSGQHASQRPAWPPGPDDADGWRRYIRCAPDLEPAVRRGADGLAHRVDRLRLCGNGVVPLVAAYAIRTLAARLAKRSAGTSQYAFVTVTRRVPNNLTQATPYDNDRG